jgi:putative serine protease PepD
LRLSLVGDGKDMTENLPGHRDEGRGGAGTDETREQPTSYPAEDTAPIPPFGATAPPPYAGYGQAGPSYSDPWRSGPSSSGQPSGGSWAGPSYGQPLDTLGHPEPERDRRGGRRIGAAVLASALLLGGIGGVIGAAGYDALDDDPAGGSTTSARTPLNTNAASRDTRAAADSPEAVAATVLPSVVKINVAGPQGQGSGSGIILSANGEILTNNHVVEVAADAGQMTVDFNDGSSAKATVVGTDPVSDLAVIQAEDVSGLTPATIGNSNRLDVGEGVVAIGSPFGLEATVTSGIVSSLNRPVSIPDETGTDTTYPAIQTDAAINPGNSGGPLVNLNGEVVGINSSIRSSSSASGEGGSIGLGFAIPITTVLPIVEQLRDGETPTHARLGVTVSDTASSNGLITGAQIGEVEQGAAGDDAGLRAGDIVTRVDDHPITSSEALVATVRGYRPGDTVTLTVRRGGDTEELKATLGSDAESSDS